MRSRALLTRRGLAWLVGIVVMAGMLPIGVLGCEGRPGQAPDSGADAGAMCLPIGAACGAGVVGRCCAFCGPDNV